MIVLIFIVILIAYNIIAITVESKRTKYISYLQSRLEENHILYEKI